MKITVIGSSNIDMCARVKSLPLPGETVGNATFLQAFGGKGANQAVATARLGADTSFISALGSDNFGSQLLSHFSCEGIDTRAIFTVENSSTGLALIMINEVGENCIAVCPGANGLFSPERLDDHLSFITEADLILLQAEIPYQTIKKAIEIASRAGVKVMFNPAPVCKIDSSLFPLIDLIVVNQGEAAAITGIDSRDPYDMARRLSEMGVKNVVVTLGSNGALALTPKGLFNVDAFKVKAVDAVGAGDTFCGALAVKFAADGCIDAESLSFATAAAAISVTRAGAQPSIPSLAETLHFLSAH